MKCEYRTWEENQIIKRYKWANGYTKVKTNKFTKILGDGSHWGLLYILCGGGLIIHFPLALYLSVILDNPDLGLAISMIGYFVIGFIIEYVCEIQRDKITYNKMIDREQQLNLFRDFGLK